MESPLYHKQERRSVSQDILMLHFNTTYSTAYLWNDANMYSYFTMYI
jgi:uncharacterized protein YqkB